MQPPGGHAVLPGQAGQRFDQVGLVHVGPGHIDRDRHHRHAGLLPALQQGAYVLPDVKVHFGNKAVLFKQGNELAGVHKAPLGMHPAHQRLGAGHTVSPQAVFGLQIDQKLFFPQGGFHGGGQGLFAQQAAAHRIVVDAAVPVVLALDGVCGQQRAVTHLLYGHGAVRDGIHAPFNGNAVQPLRRKGGFQPKKLLPVQRLLRALLQAKEPVGGVAAADALFAHAPAQAVGGLLQQAVSAGGAVHIVVQLEILDVGAENDVLGPGVFVQAFAHLAVEKFLAVQAGQAVVPELVHHRRGLAQFDQAGHPVQDHPGAVGLGHKVGGAVGQRRDLVLFAVALSGNDDRYRGPAFAAAQPVQKGVAVHNGHHHVQQDQRNVGGGAAQHLQRLLPVFGLQRVVLFSQDGAEHFPVDRAVFHNKDFFTRLHGHSPLYVLPGRDGRTAADGFFAAAR